MPAKRYGERLRKIIRPYARSFSHTWQLLSSLAVVPVATSWLADYGREGLRGESAHWNSNDCY